jgi:hypothetical protein
MSTDPNIVNQIVAVPGAVFYTIVAHPMSDLYASNRKAYNPGTDYLVICETMSSCNLNPNKPGKGIYTAKMFPGMNGNPPLVIHSATFYITFIINSENPNWLFGG